VHTLWIRSSWLYSLHGLHYEIVSGATSKLYCNFTQFSYHTEEKGYDLSLNYIYIYIYITKKRPPLCYSGQSSWLQIRRSGFDSRRYQIFLSSGSVIGSTQPREYKWGATWTKSSDSGLETEIMAVGILRADHATPLYPQKLALTSPINGGRSVRIARSRTKATELLLLLVLEEEVKISL
jgi:hypothetical protein